MKKRELKIPTLLGLFVAVGGLVSGLWLLQTQVRNSAMAAAGEKPEQVKVAGVSDVEFTVSWTTEKPESGFIQYAEGKIDPDLVVSDDRDQQNGTVGTYKTHFVSIRGLKASTSYSFKIGSGRGMYAQEGGSSYTVKTGPTLATAPVADVAYGQVTDGSGNPAEGAIVYLQMDGVTPQAALVKPGGSWVIPLSTSRSLDLTRYAEYDKLNSQINLYVVGQDATSTVVTNTQNDGPVPEIVLGGTYDYRGNTGSSSSAAKPDISKFSVISQTTAAELPSSNGLEVFSPGTDEKVNSARPEIIGTAPAGTKVKIDIHSATNVSGSVTADPAGKFSYSVPQDLEPGTHTLTISAVVGGVLKTVTRSFTVYAAGESVVPAFSATPSATPTKKATPTPTKKLVPTTVPTVMPTAKPTVAPTVAPTPKITLTPTAKPTVAPTLVPTARPTLRPSPTEKPVIAATGSALIKSGKEDLTWLLLLVGVAMVAIGAVCYKKAI
jgi:hypothetical protein